MAKDIDNAKRGTQYTADPMDLTLIWEDAKDPRIGPRDLILSDWPDHGFVKRAFDRSIAAPTNPAHVKGMITKLDGGGLMGVLENVIVRVVPCPKDIAKRLKCAEGMDLLIVTDGRSRTKEAREANRQLSQAGATLQLRVPFDTRRMSDQTAEIIKGTANLHRKILTPMEIAHYVETAEDIKTPREEIMTELGVTSWAAVETYKGLLKLTPKLQGMVDAGTIPLKAAVDIGKKHKLAEDQDKAAEALSQIAAQSDKGKVKASQVKAVTDGKADGDSKPEPQVKLPSRDRLQGIADKLWQDQQTKDNAAPQGVAYLTLQWILSGAKPETAPDFLKNAVKGSDKAKAKGKAAANIDPEQAEKARKVKDALISQRWPIRYALLKSLERWNDEGKTDQPDEFCKGQPWYPRLHEAFTTAYAKIVKDTPADKDCPTREDYFAKWVETIKE